ncbi:MAG: flavodoxin domain-containing protein [Thermoplasmatota archaeon]
MNNKALVAYFTKSGASKQYAEVIAKTLTDNGFDVKTHNIAEDIPDVSSFDTVIVGTGVRMFRVYRPWKKILKQKQLGDKQFFIFLSSGTAIEDPDKAVEKYLHPLAKKYNLSPKSMISFPGIMPEKWAKIDKGKQTFKPELAEKWAKKIAEQIKNK